MAADPAKLLPIAQALYPGAEVSELGCGSFACTFRIERPDGDAVALKVIDPDKSTDPIREEREVIALKSVDHPNVAKYIDAGSIEFDGRSVPYLVMNYVEGESLTKRFKAGYEFSTDEIAAIVEGLHAGATAIWDAGLTHRDLSPNNILVQSDGTPVIVDLGIARHMELPLTTGPVPGTPGWMSPEQVSGEFERGDERSDQFVLGLVLFRVATGTHPYFAVSELEMWLSPAQKGLLPVRFFRDDLPFSVGELVARLTRKEPTERFLSRDEFAEMVETVVAKLRAAEDEDEAPDSVAWYGPVVSRRKNYLTADFLKKLSPTIIAAEARSIAPRDVSEWMTKAHDAGADGIIDPQTIFEQAAKEFKPANYAELPYADEDRMLDKGFDDDSAREAFALPVLKYQLDRNVDHLIAPYLHAGDDWAFEESLKLGDVATRLAREHPDLDREGARLEVWHAVSLDLRWLREPQLNHVVRAVAKRRPTMLYVNIVSSQSSNQPFNDEDALRGCRRLLQALRELGIRATMPKRYSSGLLLLSLGASGWTTGFEGNVQNGTAPPTADQGGSSPPPWYYVPELLNSFRLDTRASLLANHETLLTPTDPYGKALFANDNALRNVDTDQGILLNQHNLFCLVEQARALGKQSPAGRINLMRQWVGRAKHEYSRITAQLDPVEQGGFLDAWIKVL